jgi:transcriptional regulator GlxA family with amidase domain
MQIAIVLYPGFTALDAIGPYEVLRFIPDAKIYFVSHQPGPVIADSGILSIGATHSFHEVTQPDILIVPGSAANTMTAMADRTIIDWLRQAHKTTQLTLSVCSGSLVLAAAGILKGKPATTHWIAQSKLGQVGAIPQPEQRIVKAGKIITAAGVSAGIDLALTVAEDLCGRERAEIIQLLIEYDPQSPVQAGHPSKASKKVYQAAFAEMIAASKNPRNMISVPILLWRKVIAKIRKRSEPVSQT